MSCVYFSENKDQAVHGCKIYDRCKLTKGGRKYTSCDQCKTRLYMSDKDFADKWIDPLPLTDQRKHTTDALQGMLKGTSAFLVCGGPSGREHLSKLGRRGAFSLAVNNVAGNIVRPQAFVCSDPPRKFSHSIWCDPAIMKFIPTPKLHGRRGELGEKHDGVFQK